MIITSKLGEKKFEQENHFQLQPDLLCVDLPGAPPRDGRLLHTDEQVTISQPLLDKNVLPFMKTGFNSVDIFLFRTITMANLENLQLFPTKEKFYADHFQAVLKILRFFL